MVGNWGKVEGGGVVGREVGCWKLPYWLSEAISNRYSVLAAIRCNACYQLVTLDCLQMLKFALAPLKGALAALLHLY